MCEGIKKEIDRDNIDNLEVVLSDGHKLPFEDNSFDGCFCNTVLEHVRDPEQIVKEINRVLKPGGKVIISIPFLQEVHADPEDYQRYTPYGLVHLLKKNGFKIGKVHCDYGAMNVLEYLLLGSVVWRLRIGFKKNFPFGYVYVCVLLLMFGLMKIFHVVFFFLQRDDKHFMTQVSVVCEKE